MGSVNPRAADMARSFFDAVEPLLVQLRRELDQRQQKFHDGLRDYIGALVDARIAEHLARMSQQREHPLVAVTSYSELLAYGQGHLATHRGGLWQACDDTRAAPGTGPDWRLIANGVADISGFLDATDPRLLTIAAELSNGDTVNLEARLPLPLHRGLWRPGDYQQGDEVAWRGSTWRARIDTSTCPPGADWLLVAQGRKSETAA